MAKVARLSNLIRKIDALVAFVDSYGTKNVSGDNNKSVVNQSNIPSSSRSWESVVLYSTMEDAWKAIRSCKFEFLSHVDSVKDGM